MPLTHLHVINVCKLGKGGSECRYLEEDAIKANVYNCLKLSAHKGIIDDEVKHYMQKHKTSNRNRDDLPVGDNCKGYPVLRHKQVGYDQKNT